MEKAPGKQYGYFCKTLRDIPTSATKGINPSELYLNPWYFKSTAVLRFSYRTSQWCASLKNS